MELRPPNPYSAMGNRTMFQLEQRLQEWTERFGSTAVMRDCDIEELAQHVRDSIAALKAKGLDDEEAFLVATHRVGAAGALEEEFAKVNGGQIWGYHVFWMIAGALLYVVCSFLIATTGGVGQALAASAGGGGSAIGCTSVAITALLWFGIAFWLYRSSESASDKNWINRFLAQPRGRWLGIAVALLVPLSAWTNQVSQIALFMLTQAAEIGQVVIVLTWGNAVLAFLIPIAFLFVMRSIRAKLPNRFVSE